MTTPSEGEIVHCCEVSPCSDTDFDTMTFGTPEEALEDAALTLDDCKAGKSVTITYRPMKRRDWEAILAENEYERNA